MLDAVRRSDAVPEDAGTTRAGRKGLFRRLRALWQERLALRQTLFFMLSTLLLLWSGIGVYYSVVGIVRRENAAMLGMQSLRTQEILSSTFLKRVQGGLDAFAGRLLALPDPEKAFADRERLRKIIEDHELLRPFTADVPVMGIVMGKKGSREAWLFQSRGSKVIVSSTGDALAGRDPFSAEANTWQGPVFPPSGMRASRHAAMFFAIALSGLKERETGNRDAGLWAGVLIDMPWIENTLRGLSGFSRSEPFFITKDGSYVIYPPGRSAGDGPQSLFAEKAEKDGAPGELGRTILGGGKGMITVEDALGSSPWPLPWEGPTTLVYYPMSLPGWHLGMLVPSADIGNTRAAPPLWLLLLGIAGPLCIGLVSWTVTSSAVRPLGMLADSLERLGKGDLDTPFPPPRRPDETGMMLESFEKTRVILKASLQRLERDTAAQQRLRNELTLARTIQESMLPVAFPAVPGVEVAARIDMAREVCGDLYDCFVPSDETPAPRRLYCLMGDVCGKGIPAALIMSGTMTLARSALLEGCSPARVLARLNAALLRQNSANMFVTLLAGILDIATGRFTWASAGHPPPMLGGTGRHPDGRACLTAAPEPYAQSLPWTGDLVLGVRAEQTYSEHTVRLEPGQLLLLYTDGADEAAGPEPGAAVPAEAVSTEGLRLYGEERLKLAFALACREAEIADRGTRGAVNTPEARGSHAGVVLEATHKDLLEHMAGMSPLDDISLMVIRTVSP